MSDAQATRAPKAKPALTFFDDSAGPQVGLAYGPGVAEVMRSQRGLVDYIEVPFEQLRHSEQAGHLQQECPLVLHCASLSIAGFIPPSERTVDEVAAAAAATGTPWIGEHLAFVMADALASDDRAAPATTLTYTVCPQLSQEVVERAVENLAALRRRCPVPLIIENSPQYFAVPGSTMSMTDFVTEVVTRSGAGLLLDLAHFLITAVNTGVDASAEIERLPLESVVEIHISGLSRQSGLAWDDHGVPAPPEVFDLLERVLGRARPRALTFEYNWSSRFPRPALLAHLERGRRALAG